jgi:carotenoid cleavage dioxygenase-like enzyme
MISTLFQLDSLNTVGPLKFGDKVKGQLSTAHPHYTRDGKAVNYITQFGKTANYLVFTLPKEGEGKEGMYT